MQKKVVLSAAEHRIQARHRAAHYFRQVSKILELFVEEIRFVT